MLILVNGEERTVRFTRDNGTELAFACGKPQVFYGPTDLGRAQADRWLTAFNDHWRRPLLFVLDARDGENPGRACFVLKPGASRRLRIARGPVWRVEPRLMPWADYPAWTRRAEAAGPPAVRLSCFCGAEADDYLAICEAVGDGFRPSFSTHIYKHARREAIDREGLTPRPNLAGLQTGWMERTAFPDLEAAAACILGAVERMMRESVRLNLEGLCAGAAQARRKRDADAQIQAFLETHGKNT